MLTDRVGDEDRTLVEQRGCKIDGLCPFLAMSKSGHDYVQIWT